MRISVRMLGIIASLLVLFLFITAGVIIYSAAEALSQGKINATLGNFSNFRVEGSVVKGELPLTIINNSPYDFTNLFFIVEFRNTTGYKLFESNVSIGVVKRYTNATTELSLLLNYTKLLKEYGKAILFNDTTFKTNFNLGFIYAYLFGLGLNVSSQMEWGAPLSGFTIGTPFVTGPPFYMNIPVKFSNHSPFDITGNLAINLKAANGASLGNNTADMTTKAGENFDKTLQVQISGNYSGRLIVELSFMADAFTYEMPVLEFEV